MRSLIVGAGLLVAYFLVPVGSPETTGARLGLAGGLAVVAALIVFQARAIKRARYPRLRAIAACITSFALFILLFAMTYFQLDMNVHDAFNQPMSRTDALYFTITVLSTVGFGDIAPRAEVARIAVTVQMLADLALIGLAAQILLHETRSAVHARAHPAEPQPPKR